MRGFFMALAGLTVALGSLASVHAQSPRDPVLAAYQDYRAAEQRNDLPGAEAAAAQALAASEARDGGGGSTAILAMNLAVARMDVGHKAEALAPARRALQLAQAGTKGVDQLAARLIIGEAELAVDPKADETALLAALHEADARPDLDASAYSAAIALADAANHSRHWANARLAWQSAQRHAHGALGDPTLALGDALIGEGTALIGAENDPEARIVLTKATTLLAPLAPETADASHVTAGEFEYAQAWAWLSVVMSRQVAEGQNVPTGKGPLPSVMTEKAALPGLRPLCPGRIYPTPLPTFPPDALAEYSVGAGVFRFETGDTGEVMAVILLAAAGGDDFRQALMDPRLRWRFRQDKTSPPGCRLKSQDRLVTVIFGLGSQMP